MDTKDFDRMARELDGGAQRVHLPGQRRQYVTKGSGDSLVIHQGKHANTDIIVRKTSAGLFVLEQLIACGTYRAFYSIEDEKLVPHTCCDFREHGCAYLDTCKARRPAPLPTK